MFKSYPTYSPYRSLYYGIPMVASEDVYALQTALNELGFKAGETDGLLGTKTDLAIRGAQAQFGLIRDGKAGPVTQRTLALTLAARVGAAENVPLLALKGQMQRESIFLLGNYSPLRADGSYDAGVTQRNTKFTSPALGFDVQDSISALGADNRQHYVLFSGIKDDRRRWALAQGAWNAPAFACYIAKREGATGVPANLLPREAPTSTQIATLEEYMADVSAYLPPAK
jgi:hypothetical protein